MTPSLSQGLFQTTEKTMLPIVLNPVQNPILSYNCHMVHRSLS